MARRLVATALVASANMLTWMGTVHADTIHFLPVNDNGGIHSPVIFMTDSDGWALMLPSHGNSLSEGRPAATDHGNASSNSGAATAGEPHVLPVNDNAGQHSPVISPGDGGVWILTLPTHDHGPQAGGPGSGGDGDGSDGPPVTSNPPPTPDPSGDSGSPAGGAGFPASVPEPGTFSLLIGGVSVTLLSRIRSAQVARR